MSLSHITDIAVRAIAQLLSQFREANGALDSERLRALVEIFGDELQDAEDLCWSLIAERYVTTAVGVQLDQWGVVLGLSRHGLADSDYQRALLAWQGALRSQGIRDRIIDAVDSVMEPDDLRYIDRGSATYQIDLYKVVPPFGAGLTVVLLMILEAASPSGVAYMVTEGPLGTSFRFDDPTRGLDQGKMGRRVI